MKIDSSFFKANWKNLLNIAGILGLFVAILQFNLQKKQFVFEQSLSPKLEFFYNYVLADSDYAIVNDKAEELLGLFYTTFHDEYVQDSEENYLEIVESILPLQMSIPARQLSVNLTIKNTGTTTANEVRATIDIGRTISDIVVTTIEPYEIIQGGVDENSIVVEIDRIVAGDEVRIYLVSNTVDGTSLDKIIITNKYHPSDETAFSMNIFTLGEGRGDKRLFVITDGEITDNETSYETIEARFMYHDALPSMVYWPAFESHPEIVVTSSEGKANLVSEFSP